jgi:hypothetical protein
MLNFQVLLIVLISAVVVFLLNRWKRFLGVIVTFVLLLGIYINALLLDDTGGWAMLGFVIMLIVLGSGMLIGTIISELSRRLKR